MTILSKRSVKTIRMRLQRLQPPLSLQEMKAISTGLRLKREQRSLIDFSLLLAQHSARKVSTRYCSSDLEEDKALSIHVHFVEPARNKTLFVLSLFFPCLMALCRYSSYHRIIEGLRRKRGIHLENNILSIGSNSHIDTLTHMHNNIGKAKPFLLACFARHQYARKIIGSWCLHR